MKSRQQLFEEVHRLVKGDISEDTWRLTTQKQGAFSEYDTVCPAVFDKPYEALLLTVSFVNVCCRRTGPKEIQELTRSLNIKPESRVERCQKLLELGMFDSVKDGSLLPVAVILFPSVEKCLKSRKVDELKGILAELKKLGIISSEDLNICEKQYFEPYFVQALSLMIRKREALFNEVCGDPYGSTEKLVESIVGSTKGCAVSAAPVRSPKNVRYKEPPKSLYNCVQSLPYDVTERLAGELAAADSTYPPAVVAAGWLVSIAHGNDIHLYEAGALVMRRLTLTGASFDAPPLPITESMQYQNWANTKDLVGPFTPYSQLHYDPSHYLRCPALYEATQPEVQNLFLPPFWDELENGNSPKKLADTFHSAFLFTNLQYWSPAARPEYFTNCPYPNPQPKAPAAPKPNETLTFLTHSLVYKYCGYPADARTDTLISRITNRYFVGDDFTIDGYLQTYLTNLGLTEQEARDAAVIAATIMRIEDVKDVSESRRRDVLAYIESADAPDVDVPAPAPQTISEDVVPKKDYDALERRVRELEAEAKEQRHTIARLQKTIDEQKAVIADRAELIEIYEDIISDYENEGGDEEAEVAAADGITFPFRTGPKKIVVYGGFASFRAKLSELLPDVTIVENKRGPVDPTPIRTADFLFIQINNVGHGAYHCVNNIAKAANTPIMHLNNSGAQACAAFIANELVMRGVVSGGGDVA